VPLVCYEMLRCKGVTWSVESLRFSIAVSGILRLFLRPMR
jgi:hypothetical protein